MKQTGLLTSLVLALVMTMVSPTVFAVDSYRFLHVTIDTPWILFIFLLIIIMVPFILSAVLYWYFAVKKSQEEAESEGNE